MLNHEKIYPPQINSLVSSFTLANVEEVRQINTSIKMLLYDLDALLTVFLK